MEEEHEKLEGKLMMTTSRREETPFTRDLGCKVYRLLPTSSLTEDLHRNLVSDYVEASAGQRAWWQFQLKKRSWHGWFP